MAARKTVRNWLEPSRGDEPRAPGAIVAKDTTPTVGALLVAGEHLVVAHREGLAASPGGITVRRLHDFSVVRRSTGKAGPVVGFGESWLGEGPLWQGRSASAQRLDPDTLECLERYPVCGPFAVRDRDRFVASTPARDVVLVAGGGVEPGAFVVDPALASSSWVKLPMPGGLVELDVRGMTTELIVNAGPFDEFRHAAISPDRDVLYAATGFGRTVAVRLSDRKTLWERPPAKTVVEWSGYSLALDPTGAFLALGGISAHGPDLLVLDAHSGAIKAHARLCDMIERASVSTTRSSGVRALAFHPAGWLAAATNAGVLAELRDSGQVSAFRAATRSIEAIAFYDEGRSMVVGGAEPNLRTWPVDI